MSSPKIKIETYKGVDILYDKQSGRLTFNFDGMTRNASYVFEAQRIIDEPVWEKCSLHGYFIDGVFNDYIGEARATKKDIKSGLPDWKIKGEYDSSFKDTRFNEQPTIYKKNTHNDNVRNEWKGQSEVVREEETKLRNIIKKLND